MIPGFHGATFTLPYRGDRDYIHSADIFQALTGLVRDQLAPGAHLASLVLRRKVSRQLRVSAGDGPRGIGTFSVHAGAEEIHGVLVETETTVDRRGPYDESPLVDAVIADAGSAAFSSAVPGYTAFEHLLVAMKVAGGDAARDAWLCQVNLLSPLLEPAPLAVRVTQKLLLFHRFAIVQSGGEIGSACATWRA
jgi:hypothetical protein